MHQAVHQPFMHLNLGIVLFIPLPLLTVGIAYIVHYFLQSADLQQKAPGSERIAGLTSDWFTKRGRIGN
jgi:hypothetical protein